MEVLLTGAFGNVGLKTLDALLDAGHNVRCIDLETPANAKSSDNFIENTQSNYERISRFSCVWGDICNEALVSDISKNVDAVIHLAAIIPPVSEENESLSYRVNVVATQNLLGAVKRNSPEARFIFASTV